MTRNRTTLLIMLIAMSLSLFSCGTSAGNDPDIPDVPEIKEPEKPTSIDTVTVKLACSIEASEEPMNLTRTATGNPDLFGVNIYKVNSDGSRPSGDPEIYASGVFDDLEAMAFKFVKGCTYAINVVYIPNAKEFIYKYSDGTFGYPFSSIYGLKKYVINEPVYDTGIPPTEGYQGEVLSYLFEIGYQTNSSGYFKDSYKSGSTPRYCGVIHVFKPTEDTSVTIPMYLHVSSVKLNIGNFTEGIVSLYLNPGSLDHFNVDYTPGEEIEQSFWIQGPKMFTPTPDEFPWDPTSYLKVYYTKPTGEKYLVATKEIHCKPATKFVFSFDLKERADGSIGIQIADDNMNEEPTDFD